MIAASTIGLLHHPRPHRSNANVQRNKKSLSGIKKKSRALYCLQFDRVNHQIPDVFVCRIGKQIYDKRSSESCRISSLTTVPPLLDRLKI